jgi:hypothetical protein
MQLNIDLCLKKYSYEKQFRVTESLYNYGLASCLNGFDKLIKGRNKILTIYDGQWPPENNNYIGKVIIVINQSKIDVNTFLIENITKNEFTMKAVLEKKEAEFKLTNWCFNVQS